MSNFLVTVLDDTGDNASVTGSFLDEVADGGGLSLREAILLANESVGIDLITFSTALSGQTLHVTKALPSITDALYIAGDLDGDRRPDITISGDVGRNDLLTQDPHGHLVTNGLLNAADDDNVRLFSVSPGTSAIFEGLVLTGAGSQLGGSAIKISKNAEASATATIINSSISGNVGDFAGAVDNQGTLVVFGSTFHANVASDFERGDGGAITSRVNSDLTVKDSLFSENKAGDVGGAIASSSNGSTQISDSSFVGNYAKDGGAIYSRTATTISNSTLASNESLLGGGAILSGARGPDTLLISNSTITGNFAGTVGGAIRNYWRSENVEIENSLILGNYSGFRPEFHANFWGGYTQTGPNKLSGLARDFFRTTELVDPDGIPGTGDEFLGGVAEMNGGPVPTVALLREITNTAIDAGDDSLAPSTDARGFARVDVPGRSTGRVSDLGSYELQLTPPDARDDDFSVYANAPLFGSVLADNSNGADTDPDGDAISVYKIGESRLAVGVELNLLSGARLFVNADGTFNYNPNGAFDYLKVGQSAEDEFRYTLADSFGQTDVATVSIRIAGVDDAPRFRSPSTFELREVIDSQLGFAAVEALDPEGAPVSYEVFGGADANLFSIDRNTGLLSFLDEPDFETPRDQNQDNIYELIVTATDGGLTEYQEISVSVVDIAELIGTSSSGQLRGTDGDEFIDGGAGLDVYFGGGGADYFVLASGDRDMVMDFQGGEDQLILSGWSATEFDDLVIREFGRSGWTSIADDDGNRALVRFLEPDFQLGPLLSGDDLLFWP